jgi:hypothetical protein
VVVLTRACCRENANRIVRYEPLPEYATVIGIHAPCGDRHRPVGTQAEGVGKMLAVPK